MDVGSMSDRELIKAFMELLGKEEESDSGKVFRPNQISSCRVLDTQKLNLILQEFKIRTK